MRRKFCSYFNWKGCVIREILCVCVSVCLHLHVCMCMCMYNFIALTIWILNYLLILILYYFTSDTFLFLTKHMYTYWVGYILICVCMCNINKEKKRLSTWEVIWEGFILAGRVGGGKNRAKDCNSMLIKTYLKSKKQWIWCIQKEKYTPLWNTTYFQLWPLFTYLYEFLMSCFL